MTDLEQQYDLTNLALQFCEPNVVSTYTCRPPYPQETFQILESIGANSSATVLDLGTGTGEIARTLSKQVRHIDAIDHSKPMIELAESSAGGRAANLRWICANAEENQYDKEYDVIIAAESIQWIHWKKAFKHLRKFLKPNGRFVIIERTCQEPLPENELHELFFEYTRFVSAVDVVESLQKHQLWSLIGFQETRIVPFSQSPEEYINAIHSRNGCARHIMGSERAKKFDREITALLKKYGVKDLVNFRIGARVFWGTI